MTVCLIWIFSVCSRIGKGKQTRPKKEINFISSSESGYAIKKYGCGKD